MKHIATIAAGCAVLAACQTYPDRPAPPRGAVASAAAPTPDFVTGVCGECHAVTSATVSLDPRAPGFADIANSPGLTRATLVTFLSDAHNYPRQMDVDLVDEDIEVIADYMLTLQSEDYVRRPG